MKPLTLTTPTDTRIEISRGFNAPRSLVWRAFSEPALVRRWLTGPPGHVMPECEIDFREGGKWRYVWAMPDGTMEAYGVYREILPERRIVHTETFANWPDHETLVETEFADEGGVTRVRMMLHYDSKQTRDAVLQTPMETGLEASYGHLDALLAEMP